MFTVYIIYSAALKRHYTGMTHDLRSRLKKHKSGGTPSVPRTEDWIVVWSCSADSAADARNIEKRIKKRGASRYIADHSG